jgi:hypothetical protein
MRFLALLLTLAACAKAPDKPERLPATDSVRELYDQTADRLMAEFLEDGQVVSRKPDGSPEHVGDSLIWTGVAIGVLPCHLAEVVADRLALRIRDNGGELVRFEPLPEEYVAGREISFDGVSGVLFGLARYRARCQSDGVDRGFLTARRDYVARNDNRIHHNVDARIPAEFTFTEQALYHAYGLEGRPHDDRMHVLLLQLAGWTQAVKASRAACYRANLAWMHTSALEALGYSFGAAERGLLCQAAEGLDLPQWEHYCSRSMSLTSFVDAWQFDRAEFQLQRCSWEHEEPRGRRYPGLDLLLALTELYDLR